MLMVPPQLLPQRLPAQERGGGLFSQLRAALRLLAQDLRGKTVDAGQTVVCVFGDGGAEAERFMRLKAEILPLKLFVHAHTRFLWTSRS